MAKKPKLGVIWRYCDGCSPRVNIRCKKRIPGVWKFHDKRGVRGYWGTGPIMVVGAEPSDAVEFEGWPAQTFYDLLVKHGLANVHLTDARMTNKPLSKRRHRYVFLAQIEVLQPKAVLVMDMTGYRKRRSKRPGAWLDVQQYLAGLNYNFAVEPIYHYAYMTRCGIQAWESDLIRALNRIGNNTPRLGRTFHPSGWYEHLSGQVQGVYRP
jgi:hypothetical protein